MYKRIAAINFGLLSPKVIKKMATVEITRYDLYDKDGYPVEGGVMDPRLGVVDPGLRCRVCGGGVGTCLGHFGYLELARPVIHVSHVKTIYKILRSTCEKCGRVLETPEELKKSDNPLYDLYVAKKTKCPHCGAKQRKIKLQKPYTFTIDDKPLTPLEIREWFERIPDEDLKLLNIKGGRPEWLIITLLPIPPVTVRPSITLETGERSEDDLTHKLVDIVRINQRLKDNISIGAPDFIIDDLWELLQYHVATYFDNNLSGVPQARHRSGRALRTLAQRLKGKEGRFRNNLSGKRVNFSSRTVISPDPMISINEVGVPEVVAKELTVPIKVNKRNISFLKSIIKKGPNAIDGANYVIRPDGRKKKITEENKNEIAEEIDIGYSVERHLKDGDIVVFNRQPSLHRMSMMAHKVRLTPWRTFTLNLCVCAPYNADFDGDEMNLHVPQTEEAQTEAKRLMLVENHIRSPRFGGPLIGCIQDHISGNYLLTKKETKIKKEDAIQILQNIGIEADVTRDLTGKELFSYLLPKDLNMEFKSNACIGCEKCDKEKCPYDYYVVIRNGELKNGVIDSKAIGREKGLIVDLIEKKYGSSKAREFLDRVSKLGINFLSRHGFTIGLSDVEVPAEAKRKIKKAVEESERECGILIKNYEKGEVKQIPGQTIKESLETHILKTLRKVLDKASDIIEENIKENCAVVMAKSGARGSMLNLTQLAGCIGQQTTQGERINRGYKMRTLPHFKRGELSPDAHGFVPSSFKDGLNPFEFFFNAMNGREGLMDKSLRTRKSGYMERRLVNALQDLKVEYDGTVRDDRGVIVQFTPGEDKIDPSKSEWGGINIDRIIEDEMGKGA
ncbi:MAG: DNA-directed RNA polymerase subunit A' [Candidatus Aenigmarchaeota archaeon]|nr:DNA-directed RNA polymerase subunit A' [Candidatus Aenigmarchaeota archaeon]